MLNLNDKKILITGAAGGIGSQLCLQLLGEGAILALSSRSPERLGALSKSLPENCSAVFIQKDLLEENASQQLVAETFEKLSGLDMVINLAGTQTFRSIEQLTNDQVDTQIVINLTVPINISRAAIIIFKQQGHGSIVNIGSTFGAIGFAQHSVYSAAKFGVRGFSEALRRELKDTGIKVIHIAPRATRTAMNSSAVYDLAEKTGTTVDEPSDVARQIITAIRKSRVNVSIGRVESFAAKINALFPTFMDKLLGKQNRLAEAYANSSANVETNPITESHSGFKTSREAISREHVSTT